MTQMCCEYIPTFMFAVSGALHLLIGDLRNPKKREGEACSSPRKKKADCHIHYMALAIHSEGQYCHVSPDIDVLASGLDMWREIAGVIVNSGEEFSSCSRHSFEFIKANGRNICVPAKPVGFEWSSKAVKNLAESGQVCVCLLYDPELSSESNDMPAVFEQEVMVVL